MIIKTGSCTVNPMRYSRTDTFEHTISGLLTKRAELLGEAESIRDRLAAIKNDIEALDRTLKVLDYDGDLDAQMPRQKRHVVFGRGELTRQVLSILRRADKPLTSRQIAQEIVSDSGMDARDRKFVSDLTKRVSKACRQYREGTIRKSTDGHGNVVWAV
jgi:hypothetical protein